MSTKQPKAAEVTEVRGRYRGFIPPCGVYCGTCPAFTRRKHPCGGAEVHCRLRRCKSIYVCCVERKGLRFCHECTSYPCARFRRFAATWTTCGQNLLANQRQLQGLSPGDWLTEMARRYEGGAGR